MNYLLRVILPVVLLLSICIPSSGFSEERFGVGGDDYTFANGAPDLLGDEYDYDDGDTEIGVYDPIEPLNRVFFVFNDKLYFWVLKPVKEGYSAVVPNDIRTVVGNFFDNLGAPVDFVNTLLQGRFKDAGVVLSRFIINSTIGVYGFGDIAAEEFDLEPQHGDFGQTLGVYGIGEGIYLCLPLFGPSNIRDGVGLFADMQVHPYSYIGLNSEEKIAVRAYEYVNRLSITPDVYEEIKKIALDPYVATRQAYVDYRRNLIISYDK